MDAHPRVISAILFSPRGGSSHAARALVCGLQDQDWRATLLAGTRTDAGPAQDATTFYTGVDDLEVVDFTAALGSADPMDPPGASAPMHPSYEDRAGAPDRIFAVLDDAAFARQKRAWIRALRSIEAADADVLHLHHLTPINAAAARVAPTTPIVSHLHGTELLMLEAIAAGTHPDWLHAERWAERMRTWAAQAARLVVATPRGRVRAQALLDVPIEQIDVVPNGVDEASFAPAATPVDRAGFWRRKLIEDSLGSVPGGTPGSWRSTPAAVASLADDVTFLYVGRFTEVKRLPLLVEAFSRARRALGGGISLVIVGGYPGEWEGEHPADAISRLEADGVLLAGWHAQTDLPEFLRASDVVVLPSVNESFGQVLVEGMACELPAIAVDRGGPAEIVTHGKTGWLVEPDDSAALEDAIVEAARDAGERHRRGRLAREDVLARYTWRAATEQLSAVLSAVVHRGRGEPEAFDTASMV